MRRPLLIGSALLAAGVVALGVVLAGRDRNEGGGRREAAAVPVQGGPLAYPLETRTRGFFPVDLGRPYSWGEVLLRNEGHLAVTIDELELIGPSPGLVILGVRAVRPEGGLIGFLPGWQPEGPPPEELVIAPGRDHDRELVVGLRIDEPGSYRIRGVRVRYHDALDRYVAMFDQAVGLCGPAERYTTEARCRGD